MQSSEYSTLSAVLNLLNKLSARAAAAGRLLWWVGVVRGKALVLTWAPLIPSKGFGFGKECEAPLVASNAAASSEFSLGATDSRKQKADSRQQPLAGSPRRSTAAPGGRQHLSECRFGAGSLYVAQLSLPRPIFPRLSRAPMLHNPAWPSIRALVKDPRSTGPDYGSSLGL